MTPGERRSALETIAAEVRVCRRCRLGEGRTRAVPGEGSTETEVVLVGEGPGFNEDREGRPFVGAAGAFLTELLGTVGWSRNDVFITNVVKCRPPGNRDPEPDEITACLPYLRRQLEVIDPALVVTLGRHSLGSFLPGARIGQAHGTAQPAGSDLGPGNGLVFAMYHPAAALHQGSLRQTLLDDALGIPAALVRARERRDATGRHVGALDETPGMQAAAADVAASPASAPGLMPSPPPPAASDADQLTLF